MIHAFIYLLIGSAISYFMQNQIKALVEAMTSVSWFQVILKILFDALLSVTWLVALPIYFVSRVYLCCLKPLLKDDEEDKSK